MPYEPQPLHTYGDERDSRLVGNWLTVKTDSPLTDASGAGNDLTLVGAAKPGRGEFKGDGSSAYLRKAISGFRSGDTSGTICAWIKLTTINDYYGIFSSADEASIAYAINFSVWNTNVLYFYAQNGSALANYRGSTQLVAGVWYHVAVTQTGSAPAMYVNGIAETLTPVTTTQPGAWFSSVQNRDSITIGARKLSIVDSEINGEIRDVRVYNTDLSVAEIKDIVAEGVPDQDLVLWVPYGDKDYSRFGYDLTNVNGVELGDEMKFNGSSNYLRRAEANWRSTDSAGTIMAWVKRAAAGSTHVIFCSGDEATNAYFLAVYIHSSNVFRVQQKNNDTDDIIGGSTTIAADQWYHLCCVSTGTAYVLYVNGQPESLTVSGGVNGGDWFADTPNRDNIVVGTFKLAITSNYFNGLLRDVRVLSRILNAGEVMNFYKRGLPQV